MILGDLNVKCKQLGSVEESWGSGEEEQVRDGGGDLSDPHPSLAMQPYTGSSVFQNMQESMRLVVNGWLSFITDPVHFAFDSHGKTDQYVLMAYVPPSS